MSAQRKRSYNKGVWAERIAAFYLRLKGYRVLAMRFKSRGGEVDIIALKGDVIAMVEVKARKDIAPALESVNARTRQRIENTARYFLKEHPEYNTYNIRFDVIAIALCKGVPFSFVHLDNAWMTRS